MKPWQTPRYWIFRIGFGLSLLVFFIFLTIIIPFISSAKRVYIATRWNNLMFKYWLPISSNIRIDIHGLENIPKDSAYIAVCNHQSEWETIVLCGLLSPIIIVLKRSLLNLPVFGWCLRMVNPIAIDKGNARDAIKQILSKGSKRLKQGEPVLIFPEGTRKPSTSIKRYNRTASKLAIDNQISIVPIVHNAGSFWSSGEHFKAGVVSMVIGEPVQPSKHSISSLTAELQQWTERTYAKIQS